MSSTNMKMLGGGIVLVLIVGGCMTVAAIGGVYYFWYEPAARIVAATPTATPDLVEFGHRTEAAAAVEETEPANTPTVAPTVTPAPSSTPEPSPTPLPAYQEPVALLEYGASGNTVSENFTLPECQKAVFSYDVQPGAGGYASLILKLNRVGGEGRAITLVNEMVEGPMGGQVFQPLLGGNYYFASENTDEPWQITVECHDNTAPIATGMDVSGDTAAVSPNFHLPDCEKSIFVWEAQPGDGDYASLIARLVQTNIPELRGGTIVNEMEKGDITGEALRQVIEGDYFLIAENISGPWHVRWECRD